MSAGASAFGVASAEPFAEARESLISNKDSGRSGPLHFTYDEPEIATDIGRSFPWARSLVVVGVEYASTAGRPGPAGPLIARFATSDHYRPVREVARQVAESLERVGAKAEIVLDDNKLVDRAAAARAGVGWLGKSTMILAPLVGPWLLLGSVVTSALLEPTSPMSRTCGTCVACIPACPTAAIGPGGLDARRCLSTWLQTSGFMPLWIRPLIGRRIYGCDDCLTACPPGSRSVGRRPAVELSFADLLDHSDGELVERFHWWFIPRREGRYLRRNLLVAAGNSGEDGALAAIESHVSHSSSMIRSHAAWALARHGPPWAAEFLSEALARERAPEARREVAVALAMLAPGLDYEALVALDERVRTA